MSDKFLVWARCDDPVTRWHLIGGPLAQRDAEKQASKGELNAETYSTGMHYLVLPEGQPPPTVLIPAYDKTPSQVAR